MWLTHKTEMTTGSQTHVVNTQDRYHQAHECLWLTSRTDITTGVKKLIWLAHKTYITTSSQTTMVKRQDRYHHWLTKSCG